MKKNFKELALPCLRGVIGEWVYYNTVIPFGELGRIDTEHKIKEDKALDKRLQRDLSGRVEGIKTYLMSEDERFFNTVIVGLYGDIPDWFSLDLSIIEENYGVIMPKQVKESLGVLNLTGNERLFTIDGQHRIEGIKLALANDKARFKDDELSVVFVAHDNTEKGYVRTRKLFATINREAKVPTKNDLAIIDESYAYNIVARMVYARFIPFKGRIALTDTSNISRDSVEFTNLLTLVAVNKILYKVTGYHDKKYVSPTYEQREKLYKSVTEFYSFCIDNVDEYIRYFGDKSKIESFRNSVAKKPLNLLFLPIGLQLIAYIYSYFIKANKLDVLKENINKINFDLYNGDFKFIYFNPVRNTVITTFLTLGRKLALHLLGESGIIDLDELKAQLAKAYSINELSPAYKAFKIPKSLVKASKKS